MAKVTTLATVRGRKKPVPDAPEWIRGNEIALTEWGLLAKRLHELGTLTPETVSLLAQYCIGVAQLRRMDEALATETMMITTPSGPKLHPLVGARNRAAANQVTLAKRLGIIREGGASAPPAKGGGDDDPYARLGI